MYLHFQVLAWGCARRLTVLTAARRSLASCRACGAGIADFALWTRLNDEQKSGEGSHKLPYHAAISTWTLFALYTVSAGGACIRRPDSEARRFYATHLAALRCPFRQPDLEHLVDPLCLHKRRL